MKDSSLGSFLQQLRKENQLTQKELASQLHVTDKAVSKWDILSEASKKHTEFLR